MSLMMYLRDWMNKRMKRISEKIDNLLFDSNADELNAENTEFIECRIRKQTKNNYQKILDNSDRILLKDELYLKQIKLDDLAKLTYTNRNYLSYAIKDIKGTTYKHYINGFKLLHVSRLLEHNPAMSLHEAGSLSGFARTSILLDELQRSHDPALDWMKKKYLCKK